MTHEENTVVIADIPVNRLTAAEWTYRMVRDWEDKPVHGTPPKIVTTVNGQVASLFAQNEAYRDAVKSADYIAADGMSVVFASRMVTDAALQERVATTDWFHSAAEAASIYGIKFFMLGASAKAIKRAVRRARRRYPLLRIVGYHDGYFDRSKIGEIADKIRGSGADILWMGIGNPEQVVLAHKFKELVPSLTWVRTCGGLFDFLSGERSRAPGLLQRIGLEWIYRAALEPRRLAWRYATTNVHAAYLMATHSRGAEASLANVFIRQLERKA